MNKLGWAVAGLALGGAGLLAYQRWLGGGQAGVAPDAANETERVQRIYDESADEYDAGMRTAERLLLDGGREWVCSQAHGDVLEIAVGTGRNLPYYPTNVRLTGVDLSGEMLEVARQRADELGLSPYLQIGDAEHLAFPDESFDAVVCTLSLCTIPDDRQAVAEVMRVLKPGGRFLALEHVRSPLLPVRLIQRALNPLSLRFAADHLLREPYDTLTEQGFQIEQFERSKLGLIERIAARKPES